MKRLFIAFGTTVLFLVTANLQCIAADEILACKKKNGKIRIVDDHSECKKKEEPIILAEKGAW